MTSLADCIRFALIHSTIVGNLGRSYSLPSAYSNTADEPIDFDAVNADTSAETSETATITLETIAAILDPQKRATALIELAEHSAGENLATIVWGAVEAILECQSDFWDFPSYSWDRLMPFIKGDHFDQYVQRVFASENDGARAWLIIRADRKLSSTMVKAALNSTYSMKDLTASAMALRNLSYRVGRKQRLRIFQQLYRTVGAVREPRLKSKIIVLLVKELSGKQRAQAIPQAMTSVTQPAGNSYRWNNAFDLFQNLKHTQRARLLRKVMGAKGVVSRVEAIIVFWNYLPQKKRAQAISMALQVRDLPARAKYLAQIAQKLRSKPAYAEAIQLIAETIQAIRNEDHRHDAIRDVQKYVEDEAITVAAKLPATRLTANIEALLGYRFAFAQHDPQWVAYAAGNLLAFMDAPRKAQALPLMVDLALEINLHDFVAEAIEGIAPYLDEYYLGKALEGALQIGDDWSRVWALSGLAAYLRGEQLELCLKDALEASGLFDNGNHPVSWFSVDKAARLLPSLSGAMREQVLSKAFAIAISSDDKTPYDWRIRFLPYLEGETQTEAATVVFRSLVTMPDQDAQTYTFCRLVPFLPLDLMDAAVERAQAFEDQYDRDETLSVCISYMPDLQRALALAQTIENPYFKSGALAKLIPHLSDEAKVKTLSAAMEAAEAIEMPGYRMARWLDFLPLVDDKHLIQQKEIEAMLDYLWVEKGNIRNRVLALCAHKDYISAKILPITILKAIGENMFQVCMEWQW